VGVELAGHWERLLKYGVAAESSRLSPWFVQSASVPFTHPAPRLAATSADTSADLAVVVAAKPAKAF
jgi:hypothetical protein